MLADAWHVLDLAVHGVNVRESVSTPSPLVTLLIMRETR
jgi:hypothetical protein